MLDQMAGVAHIPAASVEQIREKRLAYFAVTHPQTPAMSPPEVKSLQTSEKPCAGEIPVSQLNINNSHSSSDYLTQNRNSLSADGSHAGKMPNHLSSESVEPTEKLSHRHQDIETMGSLRPKGCVDRHSHLDQELLVETQQHLFGGLATKDPNLQVGIGQRNIDSAHNLGFSNSRREGGNTQGIFSEKIAEEIRSVLGEEGLQNIMIKVARDLKQLNTGRPGTLIKDLNRKESDSTYEVTDRNMRSSSSSLEQSLAMKSKECSDLSSPKPVESGTSSLLITRNLQQLREGESSMLARNYQQITVPTVTKNSFSSEEIYRQAFGGHSEKQYGHTYPEPAACHWQDRQAIEQHSLERSSYPNHGELGRSAPSHFSPPVNQSNMFSFPPPQPLLHFEPHFNHMLSLSPNSLGSPTSQYVFQNGTQPFHNQQYRSSTKDLPLQHYQDLNQIYTGYKSSLPSHSSITFQQPHGPCFYPPSIYPEPRRGAVFINGIPVHLPPPSVPQYVAQHSYTVQHHLQPHLPASSRREDSTQPGSSHPQVLPDFLLGSQFVRAPHPPLDPPALQPRIDSHVVPHRYEHRGMPDGSSNASPKHQLEIGSSEKYTLQRYFSSLEVYNNKALSVDDEVTAASRDRRDDGPAVTSSEAGTAFSNVNETATDVTETATNVTKTSTAKIGSLTQRLQDLHVDLDHLKHLRSVDEAGDHPLASGNTELFSKRIKRCPECGGSNKAYMDWCFECGEVLIGIEPTFHKKNKQLSSSQQKKKAMKTLKPSRGINYRNGSKSTGTSTECEDDEYTGKRCLESSNDLSPSDYPVQHQLEEITSMASRDNWRNFDRPLQKRNIKQPLQEVADKKEEDTILHEDDTEGDVSDVAFIDVNVDSRLLEEIEDPLIREFAISYRKRQMLQQKKSSDPIAHKTLNKCPGKSQFAVRGVDLEDADTSVAATSVVATSIAATSVVATSIAATSVVATSIAATSDVATSIAATSAVATSIAATSVVAASSAATSVIATSSAATPHAAAADDPCVATLGPTMPGTSVSGVVHNFTSTAGKKDALHTDQKLPSNAGVSDQTSNCTATDPGPALWQSASGRDKATSDAVLQPFVAHVVNIRDGNIKPSTEHHQINKNNKERKIKKKKKKKIRGENVDIEIFDYNETQKSSSQSVSRIVPVLNLTCSSDEEDGDGDGEDDSEEIETKTIDDDVSECPTNSEFDRQMHTSNSAESQTCNNNQSTRNHQHLEVTKATQSHPVKAVRTSPPQPSLSKSGASFHHHKNGGGVVSGPTRYQRHWARSSIAWGSYNPRELSTRSSLGNSQSIPQRGADRTPALPHHGRRQQEAGGECAYSIVPAQRRPSSAGSQQKQPALELHQRPSSATISHAREKLQVLRPPTSHGDSFHVHQAITSQEDGVQAYPPPASHGDEFKVYPPSTSQGSGFQAVPPKVSHGDGLQTYPSTTTHRNGCQASRTNRHTAISSSQKEASRPQISRNTKPSIARSVPRQAHSPQAAGSPQSGSSLPGEVICDQDSPRLLCAELHRLPHKDVLEEHSGRLQAMARSAYHKLQEMTPRINQGEVSEWECVPDEIWLHIFSFLPRSDLINVMLTSKYFHRLAVDQTLWKYITVRARYQMTDLSLATIARRRPVSLAMVKCQGTQVNPDNLHHFFRETQDRLKELNICSCSQGSLVGTMVLQVAALYCQQLTHLDASYCNVTDDALLAMSECAERFESVCLNGFQSLQDSSLLTLLWKHGQSLRTLELYACFKLTEDVFPMIGQLCPNLRRLCLGSCQKLTDEVMTHLSTYLANIEELDLRGCKNLGDDCISIVVYKCPLIHTLILANCHRITDATLTFIAVRLKNTLRVLDMCGCNRVTDEGVSNLAKICDNLTNVDISSTKCTGLSVQILADSKCNQHLVTAKFSFLSRLTEARLGHFISQCSRLKSVHVYGCSPLKNVARLQSTNLEVSIEGDSPMFPS